MQGIWKQPRMLPCKLGIWKQPKTPGHWLGMGNSRKAMADRGIPKAVLGRQGAKMHPAGQPVQPMAQVKSFPRRAAPMAAGKAAPTAASGNQTTRT